MPQLSTPSVLRRISERGGLDPAAAGRLARTTLRALAAQLTPAQAAELADALPPTLAEWVLSAQFGGARGLPALMIAMQQLSHDEPGAPAFTGEHAAVVCHVLAEVLEAAVLNRLRLALPEDAALLLHGGDPRPAATVTPLFPVRPEREAPPPATAQRKRRR